jgi:hypothetical protein
MEAQDSVSACRMALQANSNVSSSNVMGSSIGLVFFSASSLLQVLNTSTQSSKIIIFFILVIFAEAKWPSDRLEKRGTSRFFTQITKTYTCTLREECLFI